MAGNRFLSINLADLPKKDEKPKEQNKISINSSSLLGDELVYQNELTKLLEKSKGTPYEASLRKFLESKIAKQRKLGNKYSSDSVSVSEEDETEERRQSAYLRQQLRTEELAAPTVRLELKVHGLELFFYFLT